MFQHHWAWYIPRDAEWRYYEYVLHELDVGWSEKPLTILQQFRLISFYLKDMRIMANEANKKRGKGNRRATAIEWLSVPILAEDEAEVVEWMDSHITDLFGYTIGIVESGMGLSVKPGRSNDFMASLFGAVGEGDSERNIGLSAFAASPADALACLLFKYYVVLREGDAELVTAATRQNRFR